ncbi:MAG: hypothetical protein K2G63_02650 [Oscillospiraceae bacterium]|nr:hypothetical protein [Oscillospiraceae bacterium]
MRDNIYVFLDFEFNCPDKKGSGRREIISMAAIFRYADGSPLTSFYSIVKPSRAVKISARTTRLTGITQQQINQSRSFKSVSENFLNLVDCFSPSKFFVWGNADKIEVQKSSRYSHADERMIEISKKFHDLQPDVMNELGLSNPYNLERIADIYGIDFIHTFSAINDAECLAEIYFSYKNGLYDANKLDLYKQFYKYRNILGQYKLTKNNIKTSESKITVLKRSLESLEKDSDDYIKTLKKIEETAEYISNQKKLAEKLFPASQEAEIFFIENNFN